MEHFLRYCAKVSCPSSGHHHQVRSWSFMEVQVFLLFHLIKNKDIPISNISIPDGLLHWLCRARAHQGGRGGLEVLGPRPGRPVPGRGGQVGVCWQSHLDQDNEVSEGVIGLNSATKWTSPLIDLDLTHGNNLSWIILPPYFHWTCPYNG